MFPRGTSRNGPTGEVVSGTTAGGGPHLRMQRRRSGHGGAHRRVGEGRVLLPERLSVQPYAMGRRSRPGRASKRSNALHECVGSGGVRGRERMESSAQGVIFPRNRGASLGCSWRTSMARARRIWERPAATERARPPGTEAHSGRGPRWDRSSGAGLDRTPGHAKGMSGPGAVCKNNSTPLREMGSVLSTGAVGCPR